MEPIINMDFASLYGNVQKAYNIKTPHLRAFQRKVKIKKIFNL
jgi:DNA polymerase elongation subunit (family B)